MTDIFALEKKRWLEDARATARKLLQLQYTITIEDVLEACPLPKFLHRNTIGGVFRDDDFTPVTWRPSRRPASHSRYVRAWTLSKPVHLPQRRTHREAV